MNASTRRNLRRALPLVALLLGLVIPATASAQATRTWVSGVGDDVNPCSRTAPCKTFAGAISKTAEGGEINAMDPGGYGAVTITKSITIDGNGTHASILACGMSSGVNVNTFDATDRVTLRDLRIHGCKNGPSMPGLDGVRLVRGGSLRIEDSRIFGFSDAGLDLQPNHARSRVIVDNTSVHNNGVYGVFGRPAPAPAGQPASSLRTTLRDMRIDDNGTGVLVSASFGASSLSMFDSKVSNNDLEGGTGFGVRAIGNSVARIGDSRISGNIRGLNAATGGTLVTYGGNIIDDNSIDGDFTSAVARK